MPISNKQQAFINEYMVNGHNATKAYAKAYPDCKSGQKQAGSRLLTYVDVKAAIALQMDELKAETGWDVEEALIKLRDIAKKSVDDKQYSSAVSAIVAANRMFGLDKITTVSERTPDQPEGKEAEVLTGLNKQYKVKLSGTG